MLKTMRLFWWSEVKLMGKTQENYGDVLGLYLAEKISGKKVSFAHPKKWSVRDYFQPIYVTAGSILAHVNRKCVVWGSGVINADQKVHSAKFMAVRGPETRACLMAQGYIVPEVYGDPALLLPLYYKPEVTPQFEYGIIPHYVDYNKVKAYYQPLDHVKVINLMTNNVEATTREILSCKRIVSSSLHGIIVPHAYGIPVLAVRFSDKLFGDGVKFKDYMASVKIHNFTMLDYTELKPMEQIQRDFKSHALAVQPQVIQQLQDGLMAVCPFKS
jgi:pyruvyltransferase